MDKKAKILLIVEGEKLEPQFFYQIQKAYGLSFEIVCVQNNIYSLFKKMKSLDFQADIKQILIEMVKEKDIAKRLEENFTYTYLVFDLDAHHTEEFEEDVPLSEIIVANFERLQEMTEYFTDETDPTIGKIYINYPMMESFKDCDSFDDENYLTSMVSLDDLKKYKELVGKKKMANKRLDYYVIGDFDKLSRLNIKKLQSILQGYCSLIDYTDYQALSKQSIISDVEKHIFHKDKAIAVLNTATLFAVDYFGNQNGFFDGIMKESD